MSDMRRVVVAALAACATVAVVGAAGPAAAGKTERGADCVVQFVDERGEVRDTSTEAEGAKRGEFRCVGGLWMFSWAPYGADDHITAPRVQVDPRGVVSVREFDRPERASALTLGEMAGIERALSGAKAVEFTRAVVIADDGRARTAAQIEAILAGKDTTGAKVLRTVDRPDSAATVQGIAGEAGGGQPTVVYLLSEIWDAVTGAVDSFVNWVVDGINDIGDWIHDHCIWFPPPPPGSTDIPIVICEF